MPKAFRGRESSVVGIRESFMKIWFELGFEQCVAVIKKKKKKGPAQEQR